VHNDSKGWKEGQPRTIIYVNLHRQPHRKGDQTETKNKIN